MSDDQNAHSTVSDQYGDGEDQDNKINKEDAEALLRLADQLDSEADEIDAIVADASERMMEETKDEVAILEKAAEDAKELEEQIQQTTNQPPSPQPPQHGL